MEKTLRNGDRVGRRSALVGGLLKTFEKRTWLPWEGREGAENRAQGIDIAAFNAALPLTPPFVKRLPDAGHVWLDIYRWIDTLDCPLHELFQYFDGCLLR